MSKRIWGLFIPPLGAAREVMLSVFRTMSNMGETVFPVDVQAYEKLYEGILNTQSQDMVNDMQNTHWVSKAVEEQWTHILVGALSPVTMHTLILFEKLNIKRIHWFYEDYRLATYWRDVKSGYDLFCAVQKEPLQSAVGETFHYLPTAIESVPGGIITPLKDRKYDMVFIGIPSDYRVMIIEILLANGIKTVIAGPGWEKVPALQPYVVVNGWVDQTTTEKLYSMSRMGLNISQEDPSSDRNVHQISPRLYDIAAMGAIPVTEDLPLGSELLESVLAVSFATPDELVIKVQQLLEGELPDRKLQENRYIIESSHLYKNRIDEIIQWCE